MERVWLTVEADQPGDAARSTGRQVGERAGPDPSAAPLDHQILELLASESAGAMDGLAEPSRPPELWIGAEVDTELPCRIEPVPSHGQLMDKLDRGISRLSGTALVSGRVSQSGRRDSNPRPPPWQGSRAGSSDLRRCPGLARELVVFVRMQRRCFVLFPCRARDPDGTPRRDGTSASEEPFEHGSDDLRVDHVSCALDDLTFGPRDARGDNVRGPAHELRRHAR
jgi:hypothetical protein